MDRRGRERELGHRGHGVGWRGGGGGEAAVVASGMGSTTFMGSG